MIKLFTFQNKNGNRFRYSQETMFDEIDDRRSHFNLDLMTKLRANNVMAEKKSSCRTFRHVNHFGSLKKKITNKKSRPTICRNVPARYKNHRDTKDPIPKSIRKNSHSKSKVAPSSIKIISTIKSNFSKKSQKSDKIVGRKLSQGNSSTKSKILFKKNRTKKILPLPKSNKLKKPLKKTRTEISRLVKKNMIVNETISRKGHNEKIVKNNAQLGQVDYKNRKRFSTSKKSDNEKSYLC